MTIYPDSSFLVSAYLTDINSVEVARRLTMGATILITPFHRAELANAFYQWVFRGALSESQARRTFDDFDADCGNGTWTSIRQPAMVFGTCVSLTQRHGARLGVRTLDSLHVAAALELGVTRFWTFDQRQARLAEAEGLVIT